MSKLLVCTAFLTALAFAAAPARAQCTSIPGSGCPGALPVQCGGTAQIGQAMKFACPNSGRPTQQLLIAGTCTGFYALPASLACVTGPCFFAVSPVGMVVIPTGFSSIGAPIPNDPTLIGQTVCLQCADVIAGPAGVCFALGEAVSVTFS